MKLDLVNKGIDELLAMEWLETNGLGSYASASIVGSEY